MNKKQVLPLVTCPLPFNPKHLNERWTTTATQYRTLVVFRALNLFTSQGHEVKRESQAWRETQVLFSFILSSCFCGISCNLFQFSWCYQSHFLILVCHHLNLMRTSGHFPSPQLEKNLNLIRTSGHFAMKFINLRRPGSKPVFVVLPSENKKYTFYINNVKVLLFVF